MWKGSRHRAAQKWEGQRVYSFCVISLTSELFWLVSLALHLWLFSLASPQLELLVQHGALGYQPPRPPLRPLACCQVNLTINKNPYWHTSDKNRNRKCLGLSCREVGFLSSFCNCGACRREKNWTIFSEFDWDSAYLEFKRHFSYESNEQLQVQKNESIPIERGRARLDPVG